MKTTRLASDFAAVTKLDWLKAAPGVLSASNYPLYENFPVEPLYDAASLAGFTYPLDDHGVRQSPWTVIQFVDHLDFGDANKQLLEDVGNGARGLWLQLGGNIPYGGAYLGARTVAELRQVFEGAPLAELELYISGGFDCLPGLALLAAMADGIGVPHAALNGSAGCDPLSIVAATGYIPALRAKIMADSIDTAWWLKANGSGLTPFLASGRVWHQAGGSAAQELAYTLAASVSYWRALEAAGFSAADSIAAVDVALTAECDLFVTIAKFRAARLLWAKAASAAGVSRARKFIAEMSYRAVAERDPHVNILRGAAACFGAALGGAQAILLIPYNTRAGIADAFARRVARNTQLVLMRESHAARIADEAGGSWYVEALTRELANSAWNEFRVVEAHGGLLPAMEHGYILDVLTPVKQKRDRDLATLKQLVTGVSTFPDLQEKPVAYHRSEAQFDIESLNREGKSVDLPHAGKGERFAAMIAAAKDGAPLRGLERALETVYERRTLIPASVERLAEPFEQLRRASDLAYYRVGARPPVFIALLGEPADYTPRLTWARSVFEAGGLETLPYAAFDTLEALQRAFRESPAPVACLCSSDKLYAKLPGAAVALKNAGASALYVTATPSGLEHFSAADQRAIDRILYQGCHALNILTELHQILRVQEMGSAEYEEYDSEEDG
jgi:methylmalonyl-CoA mutase